MPPRVKVSREDILSAAVELVRSHGENCLNARTLAAALRCSTQPVFSNFATMEDLRFAVMAKADEICTNFIETEVKKGEFPPYKASGMAYIRFAKEERELFRLLFMRDRRHENCPTTSKLDTLMEPVVESNTGLSGDEAKLFHLGMWAYVHGVAAMFATGFLDLDWALVSRMLTDAYQGHRKQYGLEGSP